MPDTRIHVDFNDIRHGRLRALSRNADDPSAIAVGGQVELWDDDGNTAEGRVAELADRGLLWLELVRGTWRDGGDPPGSQHDAWAASRAIAATTYVGRGIDIACAYVVLVFDPGTMHSAAPDDIEHPYEVSVVTGAPVTASTQVG